MLLNHPAPGMSNESRGSILGSFMGVVAKGRQAALKSSSIRPPLSTVDVLLEFGLDAICIEVSLAVFSFAS